MNNPTIPPQRVAPDTLASDPIPAILAYLAPAARYCLSLGITPEFAARYDPQIAEAMAALDGES